MDLLKMDIFTGTDHFLSFQVPSSISTVTIFFYQAPYKPMTEGEAESLRRLRKRSRGPGIVCLIQPQSGCDQRCSRRTWQELSTGGVSFRYESAAVTCRNERIRSDCQIDIGRGRSIRKCQTGHNYNNVPRPSNWSMLVKLQQ